MTASELGIKLNLKNVDLSAGEQKIPEFIKVKLRNNCLYVNISWSYVLKGLYVGLSNYSRILK